MLEKKKTTPKLRQKYRKSPQNNIKSIKIGQKCLKTGKNRPLKDKKSFRKIQNSDNAKQNREKLLQERSKGHTSMSKSTQITHKYRNTRKSAPRRYLNNLCKSGTKVYAWDVLGSFIGMSKKIFFSMASRGLPLHPGAGGTTRTPWWVLELALETTFSPLFFGGGAQGGIGGAPTWHPLPSSARD